MTIVHDIGRGSPYAMELKWEGLEKVFNNLNNEIGKIKKVTIAGLIEAGLLVKREAMKITPVDTGNLKAGAYVIWGGSGFKPSHTVPEIMSVRIKKSISKKLDVNQHEKIIAEREQRLSSVTDPFAEIGFTASYALFVHEGMRKKTKVSHVKFDKKSGRRVQIGQAKFLEQALLQNTKRILAIIIRRAGGR